MILWLTRRSYAAYLIVKTAKAASVLIIVPGLLAVVALLYLGLAVKKAILAVIAAPAVVSEFVSDGNYFRGFGRSYYQSLWHQKEPK